MSEETAATPKQILVADDDLAILRLVKAIAEKEGYNVVTARDGREAYKILQDDNNFAVAVIDVVMPYIQGPELARYMQTENDDRRTKSASFLGQLCRRGRCFSSQTFYYQPIADNDENAVQKT
jgi:CheY-like chemotaxis protein